MRPRLLAGSVVLLLLVLFILLALRPGPPAPTVAADPPPTTAPEPTGHVVGGALPQPHRPPAEPETARVRPAAMEAHGLLAEELGQLHVGCFLGEEYTTVRSVDTRHGWFTLLTEDRRGQEEVYDVHSDGAVAQVRWDAPPGASSTTCEVVPIAYGEIVATVYEEDGSPAAGAIVSGCGSFGQAAEDGVVTVQVIADAEPCKLFVSRGLSQYSLYWMAPIAENEQRHITVQLHDEDRTPSRSPSAEELANIEPGSAVFLPGSDRVRTPEEDRASEERIARMDAEYLRALDAAEERASVEARHVLQGMRVEREFSMKLQRESRLTGKLPERPR
ncbi:MAG: hypothetical protein H6736_06960 [Alphaproteobacteria bacterium]|nr:hypothetical protein [Alphaproteobacteria bacterium]